MSADCRFGYEEYDGARYCFEHGGFLEAGVRGRRCDRAPAFPHEFTEDVADASMCVCGVPALSHDRMASPAACPDCGHQHTSAGCTGDPTPSDLWAGVTPAACDCARPVPPAAERDPLECPPDGGCGGCGNWPEHCACVAQPGSSAR